MNFLILGDGPEELAWAEALVGHPEHRLWAVYPGFADPRWSDVPRAGDFEEALAMGSVEAVVVGGRVEERGEWLRRVAAVGLPAICLHPPGDDSEAYYQVALSRAETGAVLVPDLPDRLHPGVAILERAQAAQELGAFRDIRLESPAAPVVGEEEDGDGEGDLVRHVFARRVDLARALLGEIEAITATGDPPGDRPDVSLVTQLRGPQARRAEVRVWAGSADEPSRLTLTGERGSLVLEFHPGSGDPARLVRRVSGEGETVSQLPPWDPHGAILAVLSDAAAGGDVHPNLLDGTRAMELAEATARSLRRGRTVDLHYEKISESANFKSVMTSTGCLLLIAILFLLPASLMGPALGLGWTIYIAYAIPPVLVLFFLLQSLRFAVREPRDDAPSP
jgi:myo-inositol 2-dehydrogenase/D-chiro-inositol 1-dehydrogenase